MPYENHLSFWPYVPAIDIQAVYKAVNKRRDNGGLFKESSDSENDSDIEIVEEIQGTEVKFLKECPSQKITILDLPFRDCKNECLSGNSLPCKTDFSILIMGDTAGFIKTIARMYRHNTINLNIYIVHIFPEQMVRTMLFLSLLHESTLSISEKTNLFLEIFGNTLLPINTCSFISTKSGSILEDIDASKHLSFFPNLSLKFINPEQMGYICKILSFLKDTESIYDSKNAWKGAMADYLGDGCENMSNIIYSTYDNFIYRHSVINKSEYCKWCETGIAFKLCDEDYCYSNKTLCYHGEWDTNKSSYYGDITNSPYIAFGVECGDKTFFKKIEGKYSHTSVDISKFNVMDIFTEFAQNASQNSKTINIYPIFYPTFVKKDELKRKFDAVYVSEEMTVFLLDHMTVEDHLLDEVLKKDGIAIYETKKNLANFKSKDKFSFCAHLDLIAGRSGLKLVGTLGDGCMKVFEANSETT